MVHGKNNSKFPGFFLITIAFLVLTAGCIREGNNRNEAGMEHFIRLATTTSTYDSGLLDYINPVFAEQTGITVQVVSQGTGAALETGRRGDTDVLLVHDRESELAMVKEGYFVNRFDLMYNTFIIIGPADDPAKIRTARSAKEAYTLIADSGSKFISRGDNSGTHRMEEKLWNKTEIETTDRNWYYSIGQGMGDTLRFANEVLGYTLTDRGTYEAAKANLDLEVLFEEDPTLYNHYGVMAVNPDKHGHVKYDDAMKYILFLVSEQGQDLIESYQVNGITLFFPDKQK